MTNTKKTWSLRTWLFILISLIVVIAAYFILADHYAPSTDDAYLQAYVTKLGPQVSGRVIAIDIENNQPVKKGQKLFQIDPRLYQHKVDQYRALLVKTECEIKQLETDIPYYENLIRQRQSDVVFTKIQYKRFEKLSKEDAVPIARFDLAKDKYRSAQDKLHQAKTQLDKTKAALAALVDGKHARVKVVEAELKAAKLRLSETIVYAPDNGYIVNMHLTAGAYAHAGTGIVTFIGNDEWWIIANMRENSLPRIHPGDKVDFTIKMYPGRVFTGTVQSLGPGVNMQEAIPPAYLPYIEKTTNWIRLSQRFPVKIALTHFDYKTYPLRSGATVRVTIYTSHSGFIHTIASGLQRLYSFWAYV